MLCALILARHNSEESVDSILNKQNKNSITQDALYDDNWLPICSKAVIDIIGLIFFANLINAQFFWSLGSEFPNGLGCVMFKIEGQVLLMEYLMTM